MCGKWGCDATLQIVHLKNIFLPYSRSTHIQSVIKLTFSYFLQNFLHFSHFSHLPFQWIWQNEDNFLFILLVLCSLSICTDTVSNVLHWSMLLHGHTIFKIFQRKIHFVFAISFHSVDIFLLALLATTFSFSRYVDACYCAFQIQRVKSKHIEHSDKHFTLNERKTAANAKKG